MTLVVSSLDPCVRHWGNPSSPPPYYLHLVKLLATEPSTKHGGNIKMSGVVFGDTADIEVTTAEVLRKQYSIADSARATGFPMQLGTNKASTRQATPAKISAKAIRCSFLVEHASDQPSRRHFLASKRGLIEFFFDTQGDHSRIAKKRSAWQTSKTAEWLVQDGAFVVSRESHKNILPKHSSCCVLGGRYPDAILARTHHWLSAHSVIICV